MISIWICQSARTPKIYGKRTAAMASLSLISNWLLRFVLLSVNYFIGWQVYSFKQIMQLNFICPTNREIESKGVYYYMVLLAILNWKDRWRHIPLSIATEPRGAQTKYFKYFNFEPTLCFTTISVYIIVVSNSKVKLK